MISIGAFAILALAHGQQWEILLAMVIIGLGFGAAFATMSNLIVAAIPAHQTGVANGMHANIRTIGGSVGAALMTSIVGAHTLPNGLPAESGSPGVVRRSGLPASVHRISQPGQRPTAGGP